MRARQRMQPRVETCYASTALAYLRQCRPRVRSVLRVLNAHRWKASMFMTCFGWMFPHTAVVAVSLFLGAVATMYYGKYAIHVGMYIYNWLRDPANEPEYRRQMWLNISEDFVQDTFDHDRHQIFLLIGSLVLSLLSLVKSMWRMESLVFLPFLLATPIVSNKYPHFFVAYLFSVFCVLRGTLPVLWLFPLNFASSLAAPTAIANFLGVFLRSNLRERFFPLPKDLVEKYGQEQMDHACRAVGASMVLPLMLCGVATPSDLMHHFASSVFLCLLADIPITSLLMNLKTIVPYVATLIDKHVISEDDQNIFRHFFVGALCTRVMFLILSVMTLVAKYHFTEEWLMGFTTCSATVAVLTHVATVFILGFEDAEIIFKFYNSDPPQHLLFGDFTGQLGYVFGFRSIGATEQR